MVDPIIGRGGPTPTPTPRPTQNPASTVPKMTLLEAAINTGLGNVGVTPGQVLNQQDVSAINFVQNLTRAQMKQILPYLDKLGAQKTDLATFSNAKEFLKVKFPILVNNAEGSVPKLISLFKSELTGLGDGDEEPKGPKSSGVTQYVTKQAPELVAKDVDKFLLSTIGSKNINQESRKKIMDEVQKMINAGTTTTTKRDKTGKDTVVQTPGFSEERLGAVVERVAKEAEPLKYEQQKQATFFEFMQNAEQMRGGR